MKKVTLLTLIAILIPLIVFGFLGCMKKPDTTPNFGPEVSFADIQKVAVIDTPPDPETIKKGQYISLDVTQTIDQQPSITLSQRSDEVTLRDDSDPTRIEWNFHVKMNELDSTQHWKSWEQDFPIAYSKAQVANLQVKTKSNMPGGRISAYSMKALSTDDQTQPKVTYHNLSRIDGYLPVPSIVQSHPNCGGVRDCAKGLRYTKITFDRVVWDSDNHGNITTYSITYSPDIPTYIADWSDPSSEYPSTYPSNQLQFCAQTWIDVENNGQTQSVPVQQCADIRDFQFGK